MCCKYLSVIWACVKLWVQKNAAVGLCLCVHIVREELIKPNKYHYSEREIYTIQAIISPWHMQPSLFRMRRKLQTWNIFSASFEGKSAEFFWIDLYMVKKVYLKTIKHTNGMGCFEILEWWLWPEHTTWLLKSEHILKH